MDSSGMQLKGLHTIHLALRDVQALIDRGPKQTLAKKQLIQKRQADHEAARDRLKQARLLADQKNLQLKTQEARIAEYRAKQNTAASNREYDIIKGQIAADEMSKSVLEDEIFETLEQIDKCQLEIAEREKEVAAAQAELVRYEAEYAAEKPGLEAKKAALVQQLASAESCLPANIIPDYRRQIQAHGADALAPVENRSCSACYLQLTQQLFMELRAGKPMFCRSCGRLIYLDAEADE